MTQLPTSKTFQRQYPLSFRLEDKDEAPAIYIVSEDDVDKQTLTLKIGNNTDQPIYLGGVSQTVLPAVLEIKPILAGLLNAGRTLGTLTQDTQLNSAQQDVLSSFWDQMPGLVAEIKKGKWDKNYPPELDDPVTEVKACQEELLDMALTEESIDRFKSISEKLTTYNAALLKLEAAAWALHAHFELRFRKGVFSPASMGFDHRLQLAGQPDIQQSSTDSKKPAHTGTWQISPPIPQPDQPWVSIYLLRLGETWALTPNDSFSLVLTSISAARGQGTRDTRVELVPRNVYFQVADNPITQVREQILRVINRQGSPHIPLHAGFIGPNTLLNDGGLHEGFQLQLRITNTSPKKTIAFDELSKLTLHFFSSDDEDTEGAIGTTDNVEKIDFLLGSKEIDTDDSSEEAEETFWTIDYDTLTEEPSKTQLAPREYFTIYVDLGKFSTNHPQGISFLTIRYENIPGYWDGDLHCPVEIRPLLIQAEDRVTKLNVGNRSLQIDSIAEWALGLSSNNETYATLGIQNHSGKNALWIGKGDIQMDKGKISVSNGTDSAMFLENDDNNNATLVINQKRSDGNALQIEKGNIKVAEGSLMVSGGEGESAKFENSAPYMPTVKINNTSNEVDTDALAILNGNIRIDNGKISFGGSPKILKDPLNSANLKIEGGLNVTGNVDSIIKVMVFNDKIIKASSDWKETVNFNMTFKDTPQVFAVLQGFSVWTYTYLSENSQLNKPGSIGFAWVKVTKVTENDAIVEGFVSEQYVKYLPDNALLFTLVAIGRVENLKDLQKRQSQKSH